MQNEYIDKINLLTDNFITRLFSDESVIPESVRNELSKSNVLLIREFTETLKLWDDMPEDKMKIGEYGLAYINIGCLVEAWIKLFYIIYIDDYNKDPGKIKDLDNPFLSENKLVKFSKDRLFDMKDTDEVKLYNWADRIRQYRNIVHFMYVSHNFNYVEFKEDLQMYCNFIENICFKLPPLTVDEV